MAIDHDAGFRTFLIDTSSLDVVPKPILCKAPKEIPKNAVNGLCLNPRKWTESRTRMDHAELTQAYYKELLNIKEKEVLTVRSLKHRWLVVTQKLPVSTLPKVLSRPEFTQDHESGLRSDRGLWWTQPTFLGQSL